MKEKAMKDEEAHCGRREMREKREGELYWNILYYFSG